MSKKNIYSFKQKVAKLLSCKGYKKAFLSPKIELTFVQEPFRSKANCYYWYLKFCLFVQSTDLEGSFLFKNMRLQSKHHFSSSFFLPQNFQFEKIKNLQKVLAISRNSIFRQYSLYQKLMNKCWRMKI